MAIQPGTLFVAFGMLIYSGALLLIDSVIGMARLAQYATGLKFCLVRRQAQIYERQTRCCHEP